MTQTPQDWLNAVLPLMQEQEQIYTQLVGLSDKQMQVIAAGQADELLTLLGNRQRLIEQLTELQERIAPYRTNWDQMYGQLDEAAASPLKKLVQDSQAMLDKIVQQDDESQKQINLMKANVSQSLNTVKKGAAMNRAYSAYQKMNDPKYTDRQG